MTTAITSLIALIIVCATISKITETVLSHKREKEKIKAIHSDIGFLSKKLDRVPYWTYPILTLSVVLIDKELVNSIEEENYEKAQMLKDAKDYIIQIMKSEQNEE